MCSDFLSTPTTHPVKVLEVDGGLKDQVDELRDCIASVAGGLLLAPKSSLSLTFMVAIDKGDLTTEPGVMLGSSSIDFWFP